MSQCHTCKFDERNGGTQEQRQSHCLTCKFQDCHYSHLKGLAADGMPRQIPLDAVDADYLLLNKIEPESNDILKDLELEENQVKLIMDFVSAFSSLPLRKRLTALALLEYGGDNNTAICKATGLSRSCVVSHRNFFESDPFWSKLLKRATVFNQRKRKVGDTSKRGQKKGAKLGTTYKKWTVEGEGEQNESIP